uniref:SAP domain-containing protein n=1 Tax=Glossina morsitans morsitans TaxID=37546 RepID=A0A1B0GAE5_GLOMM
MSFAGQSSAPWQRNVMQGHPQGGAFHQGPPQMFMQAPQQNNMAAFGGGGMASGGNMFPSGGGGSVSYPQPRTGLNPVAFQQGTGGGSGGGGGQAQHYNSIGTVTKINNECGLVNDEVFFYRNVCKGPEPKLGDRVIFEATYSNTGQFKWNATRIQLMQHQPQPLMGSGKGYNSISANDYQRGGPLGRHNSPKRGISPIRGGADRHSRHERERRERERDRPRRSRERDEDEHERKRRREERSRERVGARAGIEGRSAAAVATGRGERERERHDSTRREREERERDNERTRERDHQRLVTKGRRNRPIRRYMVQIPKFQLAYKSADVQKLRQRYSTLYIPSDFFHANIKWSQTFALDNPFSMRRPCQFHIMHKLVETPFEQKSELLEPSDANYLYSAKVMLLSLPTIAELYEKCFEKDDDDVDHHAVHPSRLISFLVGVRGRNEPMAIGGPWSPSLDGENPDKDPAVLIRTAIRTCKALTGVDLSNCTQWYRFLELYYHRTEYKNMEKDGPPRVETVVIFLPDVHSCMSSISDWQNLTQTYKAAVENAIARRTAAANKAITAATSEEDSKSIATGEKSTLAEKVAEGDDDNESATISVANPEEEITAAAEFTMDEADSNNDEAAAAISADTGAATEAVEENEEPAPEPTHYTLLDLKSMKVQEIRDELLARNLSDKGVRNVVMARLAKALNNEKAEELKAKKQSKQVYKIVESRDIKPKKEKDEEGENEDKMEVDTTNNAAEVKTKEEGNKTKSNEKEKIKKSKEPAKVKKEKNSTNGENQSNEKDNNEEQEEWADMDFEMSDIDASPKEMDEKEKAQLTRRYTLPNSPHIIVHPNKNAKGGKFDCAVMSLSVLLDYHPEDTKERFFEVSLFAELFNEMLMRDFGFNIYKEIYLFKETHNELNTEKSQEEKIEAETNSEDKVKEEKKESTKEGGTGDQVKTNNVTSGGKTIKEEKSSKDREEDTQSMKSETRKRKLSISTSTNGKEKELPKEEKKIVVVKPQLLLSFIYFDTTHCGYIFETDLEDLFAILGLRLSRSQIKKVLGKLATRQAIYYRKLTDKEESLDTVPTIEDNDDLPEEELQRIAAGNWFYEHIFAQSDQYVEEDEELEHDLEEDRDGLINYHGAVIHVGKLVDQIKRTEKNYSDLEKLHNDLLKQHNDLQKDHHKSNGKVKDLQSEVKSLTRKLNETNQDLNAVNRKFRDQNATISYIYNRVSAYFDREKEQKPENSKDKDTDKDKDKEKDNKDKDKEKSKEKEKEKEDKETDNNKEKDKEKNKEKEKSKDDKDKDKTVKEKETSFVPVAAATKGAEKVAKKTADAKTPNGSKKDNITVSAAATATKSKDSK